MTRLGVLTSGGDAPGMNAAIAGVGLAADRSGAELIGFRHGFRGLGAGERAAIALAEARAHMDAAGTWLGSSRHPEMRTPEGLGVVRQALEATEVVGLAVIGGGGSLAGARALAGAGVPVAFIPATIDDDIPGTETTIGMDSAVAYGAAVIAQLRVTGHALGGRAFVLETLGGDTTHLARAVARAGEVEDVLLTARPDELDRVAGNLRARANEGEAIAVMPEGIGNAVEIAAALGERAGIRVHPTILGHAQRAAGPSRRDLAIALSAGCLAANELLAGRSAFIAVRGSETRADPLLNG